MTTFLVIWIGQFVSLIGSGLTGFALGVWIFLTTGSVTQFTLIALSAAVPGILASPFAGALVDRWDRRWVMILSDCGAGLCTLVIAVLLYTQRLAVWHIYITIGLSSVLSTFQWPAYVAATTLLVPKRHLTRASGMVQTGQAISRILSPIIAGILIVAIDVWGVLIIDFVTFLFAVTTLLATRIPSPVTSSEGEEAGGSLLHEAAFGWRYIRARVGLLALLLFFAGANFSFAFFTVLFTPMILSFASPAVLGSVESVGGVGMLLGGFALSTWGGPKKRVYGVVGFGFVLGAAVIMSGVRPDPVLIAAANFVGFFTLPIINGCSQAIWQVKTPPDVQGRVFSVRSMIAWSTTPLSYLLAGPLADQVFEPMMAPGGMLAANLGQVIGTGPGRGIGLMFIILGAVMMIVSFVSIMYSRLRHVEDELPDMVQEDV
ncbi:MAG: MFS transporter [Theionarchaea archaeon]|nr:MFS transporter [Theionarchaea archaeon]MBU6999348.1 MFS transporter [Theionarchaea archaeon]MBU7021808.1 MFS transporter [Theionarchaea archaeon]MBU7034138.1 MFS transporter [Theionarchaea archaeon]MBU7040025.1 MFS transporter [Theionarchaea archaeon]